MSDNQCVPNWRCGCAAVCTIISTAWRPCERPHTHTQLKGRCPARGRQSAPHTRAHGRAGVGAHTHMSVRVHAHTRPRMCARTLACARAHTPDTRPTHTMHTPNHTQTHTHTSGTQSQAACHHTGATPRPRAAAPHTAREPASWYCLVRRQCTAVRGAGCVHRACVPPVVTASTRVPAPHSVRRCHRHSCGPAIAAACVV